MGSKKLHYIIKNDQFFEDTQTNILLLILNKSHLVMVDYGSVGEISIVDCS